MAIKEISLHTDFRIVITSGYTDTDMFRPELNLDNCYLTFYAADVITLKLNHVRPWKARRRAFVRVTHSLEVKNDSQTCHSRGR